MSDVRPRRRRLRGRNGPPESRWQIFVTELPLAPLASAKASLFVAHCTSIGFPGVFLNILERAKWWTYFVSFGFILKWCNCDDWWGTGHLCIFPFSLQISRVYMEIHFFFQVKHLVKWVINQLIIKPIIYYINFHSNFNLCIFISFFYANFDSNSIIEWVRWW